MHADIGSRWIRQAALLVALISPIACAARPAGSGAALTANRWVLTELSGNPVRTSAAGRAPGLEFTADGGRVSGFTGCNQLTGSYAVNGDRLDFPGALATTRMACIDTVVAQQEQRFLDALRRTDRFTVQDGRLTLLDEGGTPLARFAAGE
jgi:copper homeostasis protein (lipoprotein)